MPRRYKKKNMKNRFRRRRRMRKKSKLYLPLGGFPTSKVVKLRYVEQSILDGNANGYALTTYKANGLNYCRVVTNPSQNYRPSNFLRNMDSYQKYVVLGSKIKVTFITDGTSNLSPSYCGIYIARDTSDINDILTNGISELFEQPRNVRFRRVFGPSQSSNGMTITQNFSAHKFFKMTKTNYRDELSFHGTASEDPADEQTGYFQVFSHNVNGNNPGKVVTIVQIDYIVRLFETETNGN